LKTKTQIEKLNKLFIIKELSKRKLLMKVVFFSIFIPILFRGTLIDIDFFEKFYIVWALTFVVWFIYFKITDDYEIVGQIVFRQNDTTFFHFINNNEKIYSKINNSEIEEISIELNGYEGQPDPEDIRGFRKKSGKGYLYIKLRNRNLKYRILCKKGMFRPQNFTTKIFREAKIYLS